MLIIVLITDLCSETHSMFRCHHLCPNVALKKHSCSLFSWLSCHHPLWPLPFNLLVSNLPFTNIFGLGPGPFPFLPHSLHLFSPLLIPSTGPQPLKQSSNPGHFPEPWASRPTADLTATRNFAWALQKPEMSRISLELWWLRLPLPMQRLWVEFLVGELRSHIPCGQKT